MHWVRIARTHPAPGQANDHLVGVPDWLVVAFQGYALVVLFVGLLFAAFA